MACLVDAACQTTHRERREPGKSVKADWVTCPVTSATDSFGIVTSDGRYVRFNTPSNTRVGQIVRGNRDIDRYILEKTPVRAKVVGLENGEVAVVETFTPEFTTVQTSSMPSEISFDARYHDDRGRLLVGSQGLTFEDISNGKRSKSWSYSQIKGVKRDGDEIKIDPYSGDSMELHLQGKAMSEDVYGRISDRIVAARAR